MSASGQLSGRRWAVSRGRRHEPEAFFADEDRVIVLDRLTGTRKGKTLSTHVIHMFRVSGGKVAETTTFASEPKRNEEFWA